MRLMSRVAFTLATILLAAPSLHAQTSFSVAAGATVPVGKTADGVQVGYNAMAGLGFKPPLSPLGLRVEGMFNSFQGKATGSGSVRFLSGTGNVTLSGAGMPIPMGYLIGGLGMYNVSYSGGLVSTKSDNKLGYNFGAGIKFPLTGFSTFLEARLHYITTAGSSTKFVPITFGLTF